MSERFHHLVLFRLHEGADADEAIAVLNASRPVAGVLEWTVTRSLARSKGVVLVEAACFEDERAFEVFRGSEAHRAAGRYMRQVADWLVGDYHCAAAATPD